MKRRVQLYKHRHLLCGQRGSGWVDDEVDQAYDSSCRDSKGDIVAHMLNRMSRSLGPCAALAFLSTFSDERSESLSRTCSMKVVSCWGNLGMLVLDGRGRWKDIPGSDQDSPANKPE